MRSLRQFARLPWPDRGLLLRALLLVALLRAALWILPFAWLQRMTLRPPRQRRQGANSPAKLAWSVAAVSRRLPRATCLTQALATQVLLARSGYQSRIEIGVAKDDGHTFEAHAWVVCDDRILIGGPAIHRYTPLVGWEAQP